MGNSPAVIECEVPTTASQPSPPWSPWAAFVHTLLLGPLAGVFVAHRNLKRMGLSAQARTLLWRGIIGCGFYALLIARVNRWPMLATVVVSLAAGRYLYSLQEPACMRWTTDNPGRSFRSGWSSIGWGVLGGVALVAMCFPFAYPWGE